MPKGCRHGEVNHNIVDGCSWKRSKVLTNDGKWIDAIAKEDEIVINVGDMLSRYTNNKLKSTIHRVVNPPKSIGPNRYSIPFFFTLLAREFKCLTHVLMKITVYDIMQTNF